MREASSAKLSAGESAVKEFVNDRVGLSVHWGLYSILGKGEWVMHVDKIPAGEYERLMKKFNPVNFNADQWICLLKEASIKHFMVTSKHHDGFCMFDSALTDYKIRHCLKFGV